MFYPETAPWRPWWACVNTNSGASCGWLQTTGLQTISCFLTWNGIKYSQIPFGKSANTSARSEIWPIEYFHSVAFIWPHLIGLSASSKIDNEVMGIILTILFLIILLRDNHLWPTSEIALNLVFTSFFSICKMRIVILLTVYLTKSAGNILCFLGYLNFKKEKESNTNFSIIAPKGKRTGRTRENW